MTLSIKMFVWRRMEDVNFLNIDVATLKADLMYDLYYHCKYQDLILQFFTNKIFKKLNKKYKSTTITK